MIEGEKWLQLKHKGRITAPFIKPLAAVIFVALLAIQPALKPVLAADAAKPAIDTSRLSWDLMGLGKVVQSGVGEEVVLTYIKSNPPKKTPTADEVVYLHELGLSDNGIVTLLDAAPKISLSQNVEALAPASTVTMPQGNATPATAQQPAAPSTPTASPAPAATGNAVISAPAPTVVYTQPAPTTVYVQRPPVVTYVEPYPYPRFSIGFGFGPAFYGHHHWGHYHGYSHHRWHH